MDPAPLDAPTPPPAPRRGLSTPAIAGAFLLGVLAVQALPVLPPRLLVLAIGLAALGAAWLWPRARWIAIVAVGFAWCAWRADAALLERLPRELEGRDFDVVGVVDDLPLARSDATRFTLRVEQAWLDGEPVALHGRVRLSWYGQPPEALGACERWRLPLRLKRPRGLVNPGGFDAERHALERRIVAVGYVRDGGARERLGRVPLCVDGLRERLSASILAHVGDRHATRLLRAFSVGDTRALDAEDWDVARANGVTHLISISGFHVGVAALFGAALVRLLWWALPALALRVPAPLAMAPAAFATALGYGLLAGGSLPTVRTVLMIGVVTLARLTRRAGSGPQSLALALLAVLAFDPAAVLAPGFWLSFVGVAFLMLSLQHERGALGFVRELGIGQWVMTIALLPLTVWFFGEASLVGALSNLIAIPFVSLAIVPATLLATLLELIAPALAAPLFVAAGWLIDLQWWLWARMATWPGAHWYLPEVAPAALALAMIGAVWLFLPRGVPLRPLGLLLLLPLVAPALHRPAPGAFEATMIDVGQGLSVLVRTQRHTLLYDAGARYPSEFDLGEAAVLPMLRSLGIDRLDRLIVSHNDNDHAGGAAAVIRAWPDADRLGGEAATSGLDLEPCEAGRDWHWDGVRFRILHPSPTATRTGNDRSCVILVEHAAGRLLLTGDIGLRVERELAGAIGDGPPLVLVVPHHGSRTSSGAGFIAAVQPRVGLVSAGWRSRFGHPHPRVVERYRSAGVDLVNTAEAGAVHAVFPADAEPRIARREREHRRRYWRE